MEEELARELYTKLGAATANIESIQKEIATLSKAVLQLTKPQSTSLWLSAGGLIVTAMSLTGTLFWYLAVVPLKEDVIRIGGQVMNKEMIMEKFMRAQSERERISSEASKEREEIRARMKSIEDKLNHGMDMRRDLDRRED